MKRSSGVLLHITSLPGHYGIGKFGEEAIKFSLFLRHSGFSYWQVLPFGPVGFGNSPYQTYSAFAGYVALIDPAQLVKDNLLFPYELKVFEYHGGPYTVDYEFAYSKAIDMLKFAFGRISPDMLRAIVEFSEKNKAWLDDYALFMSLKERFNNKPFWEWPDEALISRDKTAIAEAVMIERENIAFWKFSQYIFDKQWQKTKAAINANNIEVIGDMPIYVAHDSSDLWANPELFKMNPDFTPKVVAGVPPDAFCDDGQLWGNPIYDWQYMEKDNFAWWIRRIGAALETFDYIRIDHFRGFESYWEVPFGEPTAVKGKWQKGPAMKLFNQVKAVFGDANIIAEDLGDIDDNVRRFLAKCGYPGMNVMQFAFDPEMESDNVPYNYLHNSVGYTGTHDNNTMLGWLWSATEEERSYALEYCGFEGGDWGKGGVHSCSVKAFIRTLWQTGCNLVIVPVQDLCGYGSDARMNVPGTIGNNWLFRLTHDALNQISSRYWKHFNMVFRRYEPEKKKKSKPHSKTPVE